MKKYLSNERGLSLVEVVAAVVLLSIILTAVYYILIQNSKMNASNSTNFTASAVARDLSAMITENCSKVDWVPNGTNPSINCFNSAATHSENYLGYEVRYTVDSGSQFNKLEHYRLREVTIKVWDKDDDPDKQPPKAITHTFQREVIQK